MEDRLDLLLRERVHDAAADAAARAPVEPDIAALVRKGILQRRLHLTSLGAAVTAVGVLVAVVGLNLSPGAVPGPSFITEPPVSASPEGDGSRPPGVVPSGPPTVREPSAATSPLGPDVAPPFSRDPGCVPAPAVTLPAGVAVTLTLDETIYARDAEIEMSLEVHNGSDRPVEYEHAGQRYDFWISRDDAVVWTAGYGSTFRDTVTGARLAPGQRVGADAAWDQSRCVPDPPGLGPNTSDIEPPPGRYVARALWRTGAGGWWSNAVEFVVL